MIFDLGTGRVSKTLDRILCTFLDLLVFSEALKEKQGKIDEDGGRFHSSEPMKQNNTD